LKLIGAVQHGDQARRRFSVSARRFSSAVSSASAIAADCLDPDRLLIRIDAGEPVEVGQPNSDIVGEHDIGTLVRFKSLMPRPRDQCSQTQPADRIHRHNRYAQRQPGVPCSGAMFSW
jgi:hypothetical protein